LLTHQKSTQFGAHYVKTGGNTARGKWQVATGMWQAANGKRGKGKVNFIKEMKKSYIIFTIF